MGEVVPLNSPSALGWSVEEALEMALDKIRKGVYSPDKVYIAMCSSPKDGNHHVDLNYCMAGMQVPEALGWLHLHMNYLASEDG